MADANGQKTGGRAPGTRNKRTEQLLELAQQGETPCAFALRIMRDEATDPMLRMQAAKIAAPYIHPRPNPEARIVTFELPQDLGGSRDVLTIHTTILKAMAGGELALDEARELSSILETHRRLVETADLEARLEALERTVKK